MKTAWLSFSASAASLLLATVGTVPASHAQSSVLTTKYTFPDNNSFGINPHAALVQGRDGNFYGTTESKGFGAGGTIFSITPGGALTTLGTFSSGYVTEPNPEAPLIQATDGSFYGTTSSACGIFRITGSGTLTFPYGLNGGDNPLGPVLQATNGSFYGTTSAGGSNNKGTLYTLTLTSAFSVLYNFSGDDGSTPVAGLTQAADGSFYGTTSAGGLNGDGTIFYLNANDGLTTIYSFAGSDGSDPESALLLAKDGNFYGTTVQGGTKDAGTIFRLTPAGVLTTLYSFTGGNDGAAPYAGLIQAADGNFYGTTRLLGGANGNGTIFSLSPAGVLTTLYAFTGGSDGINPNGIIQASDGSFWGTTRTGGLNTGQGTVFRFGVVPAGSVQFTSATYNINENAGFATITVSRTSGSTGAVSVSYTTADGSASSNNSQDYTAETGTLVWAAGDPTDKTFQVPITDRHLTTGNTVNFTLTLTSPTDGAALGLNQQASVVITQNEIIVQPTITLTSPPTDIKVVAGASLELAASVSDPSGILSQVQFSLAGAVVGTSSTVPYDVNVVVPTAPGTYVVEAIATDSFGQQSTSTRNITVIASDTAAPTTNIVTALNGREVGAGETIVVTANAVTANGTPLEKVDFYANGVLFASLNGAGQANTLAHPVAGSGPVPREENTASASAASSSDNGITLFKAAFQLPETGGSPVNIITVALDKLLTAHISSPVTIIPVPPSVDLPPAISLQGLSGGQHLQVGKSYTVSAAVTPRTDLAGDTRGEHPADVSSGLATIQYYLSKTLLADLSVNGGAVPKLTLTPHTAGEYIVEGIGTDLKNVATVAKPITVIVEAEPVVTVEAADGSVITDTGKPGEIIFKRTGARTAALKIAYKVSGTAVAGKEYDKLSGSVVIPAGKASASVKIEPIDDPAASASVSLKVKIVPSKDGAYKLGEPAQATITILENG